MRPHARQTITPSRTHAHTLRGCCSKGPAFQLLDLLVFFVAFICTAEKHNFKGKSKTCQVKTRISLPVGVQENKSGQLKSGFNNDNNIKMIE